MTKLKFARKLNVCENSTEKTSTLEPILIIVYSHSENTKVFTIQ